MAGLVKSVISLPLQLGIDTENSPVLVDKSRFLSLENIVFDKTTLGQLHKRYGYNAITRQIQGDGLLAPVTNVGIFNQELEAVSNSALYSLSESTPSWQLRGNLPQIAPTEVPIAAGAFSLSNPDVATADGKLFFVYEQNATTYLKVTDAENNAQLFLVQLTDTSSRPVLTPKILTVSPSQVLVLATTVAGVMWGFQVNTATYAITKVQLITGLLTNRIAASTSNSPDPNPTDESYFDADILGSYVYIAAGVNGTPTYTMDVWSFATSNLALHTHVPDVDPGFFPGTNGYDAPISVVAFNNSIVVTHQLSLGPGEAGFVMNTFNGPSLVQIALLEFQPTANPTPRIATVVADIAGYPYILFFYEQPPVAPQVYGTVNMIVATSLSASVPVTFSIGVEIAAQPFVYDGNIYLLTTYESQVQQTYFLLTLPLQLSYASNALSQVAGKYYCLDNAGGPCTNARMTATLNSGSSYLTAVLNQTEGYSVAGALTTINAIASLDLEFTTGVRSSQLGSNLHLTTGSMLMNYDGAILSEHNFNLYPEVPVLTYVSTNLQIITDAYDSTASLVSGEAQFGGRIAVPDNGANPGGPIGNLIIPGEYMMWNAVSEVTSSGSMTTPHVVYFVVNGVGAAPTGAAFAGIAATACDITTGMNATQVATAIYTCLVAITDITDAYTITYTPVAQTNAWTTQYIRVVSVAIADSTPVVSCPPSLSRICTATQVFDGTASLAEPLVAITAIRAELISSGQYVYFSLPCETGTGGYFPPGVGTYDFATVYLWFSNPNVGNFYPQSNQNTTSGDPNPFGIPPGNVTQIPADGYNVHYSTTFGNYVGIEIVLAGNEDEGQVAILMQNAIYAVCPHFGMYLGSIYTFGNTVSIPADHEQVISPANYALNPNFVGVGMGYIGQVIDGVSGPVAINYECVYEWVDNANELHQSAPSVPATVYIPTYVALGGGQIPAGNPVPVSAVITIAVDPLILTQKATWLNPNITNVDIAIYRTLSGAQTGNQIYYRLTPVTQLLFNALQQTRLFYVDYSSDIGGGGLQGINAGQTLYTTGGVIDDDAPPACATIINHQNRLWLAGLEDPNLLWYSEQFEQGFEVAFSNLQTIRLNPIVGNVTGGDIVAMASMDGNLIVFQQNAVWYIQGLGPDPTGNGGFALPQLVASSSSIGCRDPGSVVLTPNGVVFKSTQGFYMLNRAIQLQYIGADVKGFNEDVVSAASVLTNTTQAVFLSVDGTPLMYDFYYNAWSQYTNHQGVDSIIDASGTYNYVNTAGLICVQTPGAFVDADGSGYAMSATTAWLKVQNIQGFQRIYKAFFLGKYLGTQPYQVETSYNYADEVVDTFIYQPDAGVTNAWGSDPTWGASTWGLGTGFPITYPPSIQFRDFPSEQLCESIQFTFTDLAPFSGTQTPALNALDLEVGVRKGGFKRQPIGGHSIG
jgi:hypothetical protein